MGLQELPAGTAKANLKRGFALARSVLPGVLVSATIAMAATFVSQNHGGPTLLYALLIGIAFHFLSQGSSAADGIGFTARTVLRLGVAMLGVRISFGQIADLGLTPILIVLAGVGTTILAGRRLAAPLGQPVHLGTLTGGAVAICGASAAMAISAVLPRSPTAERDTLFTVIAVTVMSTIAMVIYPLLARAIGLSDHAAGVLLGGTIHDVAQVVGAGYLISDDAGIVATYVKLLRVSLLLPVVMLLSWSVGQSGDQLSQPKRPMVPPFLVGFAMLAVLNSLGLIPRAVSDVMQNASRWCLVCAIAALGMKTSLQELARIGWRPLALVTAETVFLLVLVIAMLKISGYA